MSTRADTCPAARGAASEGPVSKTQGPDSWSRGTRLPRKMGGQVGGRKWGGADPTGVPATEQGVQPGTPGVVSALRLPEYRRLISGSSEAAQHGRRGQEGAGGRRAHPQGPRGRRPRAASTGNRRARCVGRGRQGPGTRAPLPHFRPVARHPPSPGAGHGGRPQRVRSRTGPLSRRCRPGPGPPWTGGSGAPAETGRPGDLTCVLGAGQGEGEGQGPEPRGLPAADTHGERWEKRSRWEAAGRRLCTRG